MFKDGIEIKFDLDSTWRWHLIMWKWLITQPFDKNIEKLKEQWMKENGFSDVDHSCFLCEYVYEIGDGTCDSCPITLIEALAACDKPYEYATDRVEFYKYCVDLDKQRNG